MKGVKTERDKDRNRETEYYNNTAPKLLGLN